MIIICRGGKVSETGSEPKPRSIASKDDEQVLVAPARLFRELGVFQGFLTDSVERYDPLFDAQTTRFMRRGDAELDLEYKQLIPYVLFTYAAPGERPLIFAYLRGKGQGEARLRSKWSVGIGGHVNDSDFDASGQSNAFESGARREIAEEVALDAEILSFRRVGLVNDDRTDVGKVHLGVVCRAELSAPKMRSNEPDLLDARFRPVDEILEEIEEKPDAFESWTALALRGLFGPRGKNA